MTTRGIPATKKPPEGSRLSHGEWKRDSYSAALSLPLLNCGMPTLQDAAKAWGTSHGFTIETTSGRSDRTWGKL